MLSSLPYAELAEPFTAYYDAKGDSSRVDFYGTTVQTYMLGKSGKFGASYKLAYMTNTTVYNMRGCFQTNGRSYSRPYLVSYNILAILSFKYNTFKVDVHVRPMSKPAQRQSSVPLNSNYNHYVGLGRIS